MYRFTYGPVASRRLGRSLGVDLVPLKTCSYDCIYCQLGRTTHKTVQRDVYVQTANVLGEIEERLDLQPPPDCITFAGSGEPTLHLHLGELIGKVKARTDLPVVVLTNGSLLSQKDVRDALMEADKVIPSLDAGSPGMFCRVNRPHPDIDFDTVIEGLIRFSEEYRGEMQLEVFLLKGINDAPDEIKRVAHHANRMRLAEVQLNTLSRPPSLASVQSVPKRNLRSHASLFHCPVHVVDRFTNQARGEAAMTDIHDEAILSLLSRRPASRQDVAEGLNLRTRDVAKRLDALRRKGQLTASRMQNSIMYRVPGTGKKKIP